MKSHLLSIGELSKLTGAHISSLRYYDKIGVLKPAYIDPDTGYRYYTYPQIDIVYAIQACIELDIPLKEYVNFTEDNGQTIHAEVLLEYGKAQAEKKLQAIRKSIEEIEEYQREIEHGKKLLSASDSIRYIAPEKHYYTVPMQSALSADNYKSIDRLPILVQEMGYEVGNECGLLYFYKEDTVERYQFIEIVSDENVTGDNVMTIPSGYVLAKTATPDKIEQAALEFPDLFHQSSSNTVVLTEILTENVDVNNLPYELRCYLRQ